MCYENRKMSGQLHSGESLWVLRNAFAMLVQFVLVSGAGARAGRSVML
jgi:hypothetical protein